MRRRHSKESYQPRVKIAAPWEAEIEVYDKDGEGGRIFGFDSLVILNLISTETGEIRQKRFSVDTLARRMFASEFQTARRNYGENTAVKIRPRGEEPL